MIADKIHFAIVDRRLQDDCQFKRIATALFSNKQMRIQYRARGQNGENSERIISAQKLIYYRDNWYLAAHCHYRNELRMFSVDRVYSAQILEAATKQIAGTQLQNFIHSSYGIFTGKADQWHALPEKCKKAGFSSVDFTGEL